MMFRVTCLALLLLSTPALADAAGDTALKAIDDEVNLAKSHYFEYDVVDKEPDKDERHLYMKVWLKDEKRLTELTAPADMKGTKVLIVSTTQVYVYLPAFGKVRRIASSLTEQSFLGLVFTQDDLANQRMASRYNATVAGDDKLVLTPKPGQNTGWGKLELTYLKDKKVPSEIKYFNDKGELARTETRGEYSCEGEICVPGFLMMTDHGKGGHWSKFVRKQWKANPTVSDDLFTQRSLTE
jgi:outer membrane lipoprotein-sorting protein